MTYLFNISNSIFCLVRGKEILSRLHFSATPVFALGNWLPRVLYSWGCGGHNCGLAQVLYSSPGECVLMGSHDSVTSVSGASFPKYSGIADWSTPVIAKRLGARYDWLNRRWGADSYRLLDAGDGCKPVTSVKGAVAWVSEGGCSFFTKVSCMS